MRARRPLSTFEFATYCDEMAGFEFYYPASWILSDDGHSEAQITVNHLTAQQPDPSQIDVAVASWQPNDLDGYAALREETWSNIGMTIHSRKEWLLGDGGALRAFCYLVEAGYPIV